MDYIIHAPPVVWLFAALLGVWLIFNSIQREIGTRRIKKRREREGELGDSNDPGSSNSRRD